MKSSDKEMDVVAENTLSMQSFGDILKSRMKKDSKIKVYNDEEKSFVEPGRIVDGRCQEHLYTILFEALTHTLEEPVTISKSGISESLNKKLKSEILKAAQESNVDDVSYYFENNLIPNIPDRLRSIVVDSIEKLVEGDETLGKTTIKSLKGKKKRNDYARFLAEVWVLAVCQSNTDIKNKKLNNEYKIKETMKNQKVCDKYKFVFNIDMSGMAEPFSASTEQALKEWFEEKAIDVVSEMRNENLRETFTVEIDDKRISEHEKLDALIHQKLANNEELNEHEDYLKFGVKRVLKRDHSFIKSAVEMFLSNRVARAALSVTHYKQLESVLRRILQFRYGDLCFELPNNRELLSLDVYLNSNGRNAKHEEFIAYVRKSDVEALFGGTGIYDLYGRSVMELSNCREDVILYYSFFLAELDLSGFDFSKDDRMLSLLNFFIGLH